MSGQKNDVSYVLVQGEAVGKYSKIVPILIGTLAAFYISIRTIYIKHFKKKYGISAPEFISLSCVPTGVVFLVLALVFLVPEGVPIKFVVYGLIGSVFQQCAMFVVYYATSTGLAGPASAIVSLQVIISVVLELVINGQIPLFLEILGVILGISGAMIISVGGNLRSCLGRGKGKKYE